eukprot:473195_1
MVSLIHVQIRMTTILVQIPISNPKHTHVLQSLKALDKTQQLDKKNYPHCDECEKATPHTVDTIITPGDTLFVTLARHKKHLWPSRYMQKDPRHIKYCHHMKFKNRYYDLQAVTVHVGKKWNNGHYYTYAWGDKAWYLYDDNRVT